MDEAAVQLLKSWTNKPLKFANEAFESKPREFQPDILHAIGQHNRVAVAACRELGKSRLAAYAALWFLTTKPNSLVYTLAPVWDQVEGALWVEIRDLWNTSVLSKIFPHWAVLKTELQVPGYPKWRAVGRATNDVQNLEGKHADHVLVIIDESKGVADSFFNSIHGMLAKPTSKVLAIGTPGQPQGWFYKCFKDPAWKTFRVRADEIPRLAAHCAAEEKRLGRHNPFFRQQQLAEFTGADTGGLLSLDKVTAAVDRFIEPSPKWSKVVALDPAGRGADESVLTFRNGPTVVGQEAWQGWDEMKTAGVTVERARQFDAKTIVVDEVGLGASIRSRIQQLAGESIRVVGFNSGHAAKNKERFANRKAEACEHLRTLFEEGQISIPDSTELVEQLLSWKLDSTPNGKSRIVDPDDSPDRADSLMMAFAADRIGEGFRFTHIRGIA